MGTDNFHGADADEEDGYKMIVIENRDANSEKAFERKKQRA